MPVAARERAELSVAQSGSTMARSEGGRLRTLAEGTLALVLGVILGLGLVGCGKEEFANRFADDEIALLDDLFAASAVGEDHLWAAGYFGAIYHTKDGGHWAFAVERVSDV